MVLRRLLATYDIRVEPSNRIGSIEQCQKLFDAAGFKDIEIKQEQHGSYTSFENARTAWKGVIEAPSELSLKVSDGISQLTPAQLEKVKSEFESALTAQQTEKGLWDDLTTLYVLGQKPDVSC